MFIGEYRHSIDEKGRIAVPQQLRKALGKKAILTRGLDQSLFIYTFAEWKKLADKLASLPFSQANTRAFTRLMLAGAMDTEVDRQGRVIVPEYLRNYSGLKKNVVIVGVYNRVEVWDAARWETYRAATEKDSNAIAEKMGELGI